MKRFNPFRTVVIIPLLVILVGVVVFLSRPFLKGFAEKAASAALATKVSFSSFSLAPWSGSLFFADLAVRDRDDPSKNVLFAKNGEARISIWELLRGRAVIKQMVLRGVRMHVERREDGSLNVERLGKPEKAPPPPEEVKKQAKKTDWVKTLKDAAKKLKEWYEKKRAEEARRKEEERKKKKVPPAEKVRGRRAEYVFRDQVRFVIERIAVEDLELVLEDKTKKDPLPPFTGGTAEIRNLSSSPLRYEPPLTFTLAGAFGSTGEGGALKLEGEVDLDLKEPPRFFSRCSAERLAVALLKPLFGLSLPVRIESGRCNLKAELSLKGFSLINLKPDVALQEVKLAPDGVHRRVLGIPASDFCEAVNQAGSFSIEGLRIEGPLESPRFHWSPDFRKQLKELLIRAGKAYLLSEVDKRLGPEVEKIKEKAQKVLGEKAAKALGGKASEKAEGILKKGLKLLPGLGK